MSALDWIMLIILLALEIPAATFLVVAWVRACREEKNRWNVGEAGGPGTHRH